MIALDELPAPATLAWHHPDPLTRAFELRVDAGPTQDVAHDAAHDALVATLRFTNLAGSRAVGAVHDAGWAFHRTGIFRPRVEVRPATTPDGAEDDVAPVALIDLAFSGAGVLRRPRLADAAWTVDADGWGWTVDGARVLTMAARSGGSGGADGGGLAERLFGWAAEVAVTEAGMGRADLGLLLVAGGYLLAAQQFDLVANPPGF